MKKLQHPPAVGVDGDLHHLGRWHSWDRRQCGCNNCGNSLTDLHLIVSVLHERNKSGATGPHRMTWTMTIGLRIHDDTTVISNLKTSSTLTSFQTLRSMPSDGTSKWRTWVACFPDADSTQPAPGIALVMANTVMALLLPNTETFVRCIDQNLHSGEPCGGHVHIVFRCSQTPP